MTTWAGCVTDYGLSLEGEPPGGEPVRGFGPGGRLAVVRDASQGAMAVFFQLFVTGYEERRLARRFGRSYLEYRSTVPRWIPRPPPTSKIS